MEQTVCDSRVLPITVLDEFGSDAEVNDNISIVDVTLHMSGRSLQLQIGLSDNPATPADIIPLARTISAKIAEVTINNLLDSGHHIPCSKKCATCCGPGYLVFLSTAEALWMRQQLASILSVEDDDLIGLCNQLSDQFEEQLPDYIRPAFGDHGVFLLNGSKTVSISQKSQILDCWKSIKHPCPFLDEGLCRIYELRPIICREHLVVGSAAQCQSDAAGKKAKVEMAVSIPEVLTELVTVFEGRMPESVVLPSIFKWYDRTSQQPSKTWPAEQLFNTFMGILSRSMQLSVRCHNAVDA